MKRLPVSNIPENVRWKDGDGDGTGTTTLTHWHEANAADPPASPPR